MLSKINTLRRFLRTSKLILSSVSDSSCSFESFLSRNRCFLTAGASLSVDLGAGNRKQNPFQLNKVIGIDIGRKTDCIQYDLFQGLLPFEDASVDVYTAFHFLEHVPRVGLDQFGNRINPFLCLMNECARTLSPNGLFLSVTPAYPFEPAFSDPTHVNFLTEKTFRYYLAGINPIAAQYGYSAKFELLDQAWDRQILMSVLRKTS